MRKSITFLVAAGIAVVAAAACSSDSSSTTDPTGGTSTTSSGVTISADTTLKTDSVAVGSVLVVPVHVTQNGAPLANVIVGWAVSAGGGSVSAASSVTDAGGLATVSWTLSDTTRANALTASITGASVVISATTIAGPASTMVKVSPDSTAVVTGGSVVLTARPVDRFGNGVAGVTVNWTVSGGSVSVGSTVSGSNGNATTNFTTGALPGPYTVTATVPGKASVTFKVVGL